MLLRLAWRNIWRNTRRTIISVAALALGVAAIVSIHSVQETAYAEMIGSITKGLVGDVQVHGHGYQDSPEMTTLVPNPAVVEAKLKRALPGAEVERRVMGGGLAGAGDRATPVMVMGIEPGQPGVRAMLTIEKGHGLDRAAPREVVIGNELARELGLVPGSEMVLVGQAVDGSLANDRFTVAGIADAGTSEANASAVFLRLEDAQEFFGLDQGVHQVIVRLPEDAEDLTHPVSLIRGALDLSALEVMPWTDILPELKGAIDAKRRNSRLIDLVVFLIVSLGILNTMTMSTFERTREFGVMASLGTRRGRVLAMVLLEALLQGLIGLGIGVTLAWALLHGIGTVDYGSLTNNTDILGARLGVLRLVVDARAVVQAGVITLLTMLVGALAPAIRSARLEPVEATRYV